MFEPQINRGAKSSQWRRRLVLAGAAIMLCAIRPATGAGAETVKPNRYYLPDAQASKIVTVSLLGNPATEVIVLTQPVAVRETGPQSTIDHFGEIYEFSPAVIAVHRDEPTLITFWNLQSDDDHDFALLDRNYQVIMYVDLPPLIKTSYIFTFHKEGLFDFKCLQHQPEMAGQIMVLPPLPKHR